MITVSSGVLPLLLLSQAPQIDCENAMTQMEMNYCAHEDFKAADARLNAQWSVTSAEMKRRDQAYDDASSDGRPGYFATLLAAQRAWLTYRDAHCRSEGYEARGGSLEPLLVSSCKAHLTNLRTADLEELARTY